MHDTIGCQLFGEYCMSDIRLALKFTLVGLVVMLILGRVVLHIAVTFLLPLLILFAIFFLVFVVGARMLFKR
jgi:hypothetical protein